MLLGALARLVGVASSSRNFRTVRSTILATTVMTGIVVGAGIGLGLLFGRFKPRAILSMFAMPGSSLICDAYVRTIVSMANFAVFLSATVVGVRVLGLM